MSGGAPATTRETEQHKRGGFTEPAVAAQDKAARLEAKGLQAAGWRELDFALRRKGDLVKMDLALRLRRETTMPLRWICHRLAMGSWKSVTRRFYE